MRLINVAMLLLSCTLHAAENPDVQTEAEISRAREVIARDFADSVEPQSLPWTEQRQILGKYSYLDPHHEVPQDLLQTAVIFYDKNISKFPNSNYITVVDFSRRSDNYRFFLINMHDGSVEKYHTTHGHGSDPNKTGTPIQFGNVENSARSSLGFVRTGEVYKGDYNVSVRLDGLSDTNTNLRKRAVVFHGWDYVYESNVIQGMSAGCITLDWKVKDGVLGKIKEGSLMYVGVSSL